MNGLCMDSDSPEESSVDLLDEIRKLEITYSRRNPGVGICFVEYLGARIRVYEVERFLIGHLLEHLGYRDA